MAAPAVLGGDSRGGEEGTSAASSSFASEVFSGSAEERAWLSGVVKSPASLVALEENGTNRRCSLAFAFSRLHALVSGSRRGGTYLQRKAFLEELSRLSLFALKSSSAADEAEGKPPKPGAPPSALGTLNVKQLWALLDAEGEASLKRVRRRIRALPTQVVAAGEEGRTEGGPRKRRRRSLRNKHQQQDGGPRWSALLPEARRELFPSEANEAGDETEKEGAGDDSGDSDRESLSSFEAAADSQSSSADEASSEEATDGEADEGEEESAEAEAEASAEDLLDDVECLGSEEERANAEEPEAREGKRDRRRTPRHPLDDEFFSLQEMNKFADEAEAEMEQQRGRRRGGPEEEEEEDEDEEDEEEAEARALLFEGVDAPGADGRDATYEDFFGKKRTSRKHANSAQDGGSSEDWNDSDGESGSSSGLGEEEEDEEEKDFEGFGNNAPLDAEDRRLEAVLDKLQREIEEQNKEKRERRRRGKEKASSGAHLPAEAEEADGSSDSNSDQVSSMAPSSAQPKSPLNSRKAKAGSNSGVDGPSPSGEKLSALEARIAALEEELVAPKSWELTGEVWAKQRPKDALLGLEGFSAPLPFKPVGSDAVAEGLSAVSGLGDSDNETTQDLRSSGSGKSVSQVEALSAVLERLVKGRIEAGLFDDVQRKAPPPPPDKAVGSNRAGAEAAAEAEEEVNTAKPTEGLAEMYAREYQHKVLGRTDAQKEKLDADKTALLELFGKLMYKLDALSHNACTPRPAAASAEGAAASSLPFVRVEEAVPVFVAGLASEAADRTKAQASLPKLQKSFAETSREERRALRRSKKAKRRAALRRRIDSGELTPQQAAERARRLQEKNLKAKAERKEKRLTGLTHSQAIKEMRKGQRRVKTAELLADALRAKAKKAGNADTRR